RKSRPIKTRDCGDRPTPHDCGATFAPAPKDSIARHQCRASTSRCLLLFCSRARFLRWGGRCNGCEKERLKPRIEAIEVVRHPDFAFVHTHGARAAPRMGGDHPGNWNSGPG